MSGGRPRTAIGTYGAISTRPNGRGGVVALARIRDADGRLRPVTATARTGALACAELKKRMLNRPGYGAGGLLTLSSSFGELAALWLADMERQELSESTRKTYRANVEGRVLPALKHFTLGEISTGRVETFLRAERAVSYSRARESRTMLNLLFGFAMRHDGMTRNPVEGTSRLEKPKGAPRALAVEQIGAIRTAAAHWRTGPEVKGPKPDGQVRDLVEVLLGTALRPGEALALRPRDITETRKGMVLRVTGTVVLRTGRGAVRQDHPKTENSVRAIAVPEFAAAVLRRRLAVLGPEDAGATIFRTRDGAPLSPYNVRRTFREFLALAGLAESGISLRWFRRTGATVIARGLSVDAAASYLGHGSTAITEGHYIQPDETIDRAVAETLERTLRPVDADTALLALASDDELVDADPLEEWDDEDEADEPHGKKAA